MNCQFASSYLQYPLSASIPFHTLVNRSEEPSLDAVGESRVGNGAKLIHFGLKLCQAVYHHFPFRQACINATILRAAVKDSVSHYPRGKAAGAESR